MNKKSDYLPVNCLMLPKALCYFESYKDFEWSKSGTEDNFIEKTYVNSFMSALCGRMGVEY